MINNEQQKWQNYIKQTPIKNITELQNGDIFYIDTDNSYNTKNESNHKFRPVILIDGKHFDDYHFALNTSEYNKKYMTVAQMPHITVLYILSHLQQLITAQEYLILRFEGDKKNFSH